MPVIPGLGRLRQGDGKFKVRYIAGCYPGKTAANVDRLSAAEPSVCFLLVIYVSVKNGVISLELCYCLLKDGNGTSITGSLFIEFLHAKLSVRCFRMSTVTIFRASR